MLGLRLGMRRGVTAPIASTRSFATSAVRRKVEENISAERLKTLITATEQSKKPLLVDFFADWCQPCKLLSPTLMKLANSPQEAGREIDLVTIDVDAHVEAAQGFQVRLTTTTVLTLDPRDADRSGLQQWPAKKAVCRRAAGGEDQGIHPVRLDMSTRTGLFRAYSGSCAVAPRGAAAAPDQLSAARSLPDLHCSL